VLKFDDITDPQKIEMLIHNIIEWIDVNVLVLSSVIQAIIIVTAFVIAWAGASRLSQLLNRDWGFDWYTRFGAPITRAIAPLSLSVIWIILQWFSVLAAENAKWPNHLIKVVVSLLTAWIVIRLAATLIRNKQWSRVITILVWVIAALSITNLLEPTQIVLADMGIHVGDAYISVLSVIKASIALGVLLYFAGFLANLLDRRLANTPDVSPSARVLFSKFFRISIFTVAIVVGLESVGIDLTAFAVFSGAVGLGLGFGLQKVIANLISGIILLMDKSVKPGDVISLGTTYGEIKTLGARYVSVITRDGTEHLIPNEELISQRVENWSFSNRMIRLRMPIGISYDSDVHKAITLALDVAAVIPRVLDEPKPVCQLTAFGESSLDLELRVWVNDPQNGLGVVRSQVLLGIWDKFKSNGIEFPYPQRDIHIKSAPSYSSAKAIDELAPSHKE
jgi:small-conductance mechanosensitive channel